MVGLQLASAYHAPATGLLRELLGENQQGCVEFVQVASPAEALALGAPRVIWAGIQTSRPTVNLRALSEQYRAKGAWRRTQACH